MSKIAVKIDKDGQITMEGIDFKGTACDAAMAALEKSLGMQTKRVNKADYYDAEIQGTQNVGGTE